MSQRSLYEFFKSTNPKSGSLSKRKKKEKSTESSKQPGKIFPVKSQPTVEMINLVDVGSEEVEFSQEKSARSQLEKSSLKSPSERVSNKDHKRTLSQQSHGAPSPRKKIPKSPATAAVRRMRSRGPRKAFHSEGVDTGKVSNMIDNLNLTRLGILPRNNFCLEEIYSTDETVNFLSTQNASFDMDKIQMVYDAGGVIIPRDEHAKHLFNMITEVFSNHMNCSYFNDDELDQIFIFLTLSEKAQMLFVRMIKRQHQWQKSSSIDYPEIDSDLKPHFDTLEAMGFYTSDTSNVDLGTLLGILKINKVRDVCAQFKLPWKSNKKIMIEKILERSKSTNSLFGAESPAKCIRKFVLKTLGHCVCLREDIIGLVDRIVTLFSPWDEISATLSDLFLNLMQIKKGFVTYPETPVKNYPRFRDRDHLVRYVEWKNNWRQVDGLVKTNPENWEMLKNIGRKAHSRFMNLLAENSDRQAAAIPRHVMNYSEEYVCAKLVTICLEVFKREVSLVPEAIMMLKDLIEQQSYLQSKKGAFYEELALIETKHRKNLEAAAAAIITGLSLDNLTENARIDLLKRAHALHRRRSGLTSETKSRLADLIKTQPTKYSPNVVTVDANVIKENHSGRKSTWYIDMGDGDKEYMSVEGRASHFYREMGYVRRWHCEGSLPVTLFTLLMWEEIYLVSVPAAYLSPYQKAPLDIYTSDFYANRKEYIDRKIRRIEAMSPEELASEVEASIEKRKNYESLMPNRLPVDNEDLKNLVKCMGTAVVAGICKRMATNFIGYRAGFPDLVVWNPRDMKCKIVEVKGPGDSLSAKQTLWLGYLDEIGADTELCEVKMLKNSINCIPKSQSSGYSSLFMRPKLAVSCLYKGQRNGVTKSQRTTIPRNNKDE